MASDTVSKKSDDAEDSASSARRALSLAWGRLGRPENSVRDLRGRIGRMIPRGLLAKIVTLNIIPLILFFLALKSFGMYRANLIESELMLLQKESLLVSVLISQAVADRQNEPRTSRAVQEHIAMGLPQETGLHIAASDRLGQVFFDSRAFWSAGRLIPKDRPRGPVGRALNDILSWTPIAYNLPLFPGPGYGLNPINDDFQGALHGEGRLIAYADDQNRLVLTSFVPLRLNGVYIGVAQISRSDDRIASTAGQMQLDIARILIMAFFLTLALSLYLTAFIAHPLRRLSRAAEQIKTAFDETLIKEVRDLRKRRDEIGDLAKSFEAMTDALIDRLQNSEQFAADVAHELKNPLTSMRSAFETFDKVKDAKKREALREIIAHDIERLDRLITDIAKSSRLDAELAREEFAPLALAPFLEDMVASYLPLIDERHAALAQEDGGVNDRVVLDIQTPRKLKVQGHADRLAQVLLNVIDNALTFSPPGIPVRVNTMPGGRFVRIIVDDSGPGIPENKLEAIFDRFYTERPAGEAFGSHSGLGLAISRQIVNAHGGRIWAENRKNGQGQVVGSRFIVQLPLYARGETPT
jgi:two-component system sensor histidine kinase ChvG